MQVAQSRRTQTYSTVLQPCHAELFTRSLHKQRKPCSQEAAVAAEEEVRGMLRGIVQQHALSIEAQKACQQVQKAQLGCSGAFRAGGVAGGCAGGGVLCAAAGAACQQGRQFGHMWQHRI